MTLLALCRNAVFTAILILAYRSETALSETEPAWRGACTDHLARRVDPAQPHASWDLDVGDCASWLRALDICANYCRMLEPCRTQRRVMFPDRYPSGVIWAGVPYGETGQPLDSRGLRRLAATRHGRATPDPQQSQDPTAPGTRQAG